MKPFWILRHHGSSGVRSVDYGSAWLAIGDEQGKVSLVDLTSLRAVWHWKAHNDALLTVTVLAHDRILTHARDNCLKVWDISAPPADASEPKQVQSIGVNALNFARCSYSASTGTVAVPNTLDPAYIDVLHLESGKRIHEAVSRPDISSGVRKGGGSRQPIVMSLHLLGADSVLAGYEDGQISRWSLADGMQQWSVKCHSESVMSSAISHHATPTFGVSVGADDRIARFDIGTGKLDAHVLMKSTTPGNASVAIAPNNLTLVVGGWDGSIRVYSAHKLELLGRLNYHRDTVDTLAFCPRIRPNADSGSDSEDAISSSQVYTLAAGGRDGKISLWHYN